MGVVRFADNQVMYAEDGTPMTLTTDPHPMGGNDYLEVVWNIHRFAGGGTPALQIQAQGSNDGQTWFDAAISDATSTIGANIVRESGGFLRTAFLRFEYTLTAGSSTNAWAAFDVHANLMKSGS